jgi:hypothetical protein
MALESKAQKHYSNHGLTEQCPIIAVALRVKETVNASNVLVVVVSYQVNLNAHNTSLPVSRV